MVLFIWLLKINRKSSSYKKITIRLENYALSNWLLLWAMAFLYYEAIPVFSAKFWLLLWIFGSGYWLIRIYSRFKKHHASIEQNRQGAELNKYIPKKAS